MLGEPYLLARWPEIFKQVSETAGFGKLIPARFAISVPALLIQHAENVFRFVLGPISAALCLIGFFIKVDSGIDGTVNSAVNPVKIGGYISLYATGEGQTMASLRRGPWDKRLLALENALRERTRPYPDF